VGHLAAPEYPLAMAVRAGPALSFSWPSGYRGVGDCRTIERWYYPRPVDAVF